MECNLAPGAIGEDIWKQIVSYTRAPKLHAAYRETDTEFVVTISQQCYDYFDNKPIRQEAQVILGRETRTAALFESITGTETRFYCRKSVPADCFHRCFVFSLGADLCDKNTNLLPLLNAAVRDDCFQNWIEELGAHFNDECVLQALQNVVRETLKLASTTFVCKRGHEWDWACYE